MKNTIFTKQELVIVQDLLSKEQRSLDETHEDFKVVRNLNARFKQELNRRHN